MRRAVVVWVGCIATGAGCSLLTDLGGLASPDAATLGDGSVGDAPVTDGGSDGQATDATANLLMNADFEQGSGGCGPGWTTANSGSMTRWGDAHAGLYSCMVCGSAVGPFNLFASPQPVTNPMVGASYFAQAYFAMVPDAAINGVGLEPFEYFDSGSGTMLGYSWASGSVQGWQVTQVSATIQEAGVSIGFEIHASVPDGAVTPGCFLIDDTEIVQQ